MNHDQPADDGIPVLTDVVDAGQAALALAIAAQPVEALAAAHTATDAKLEKTSQLYQLVQPAWPGAGSTPRPTTGSTAGPAVAPLIFETAAINTADTAADEIRLEELTLRVQSRVLAGLIARIDPLVEQRLRESLTDLLEQVLAGMTAELKVTARNIVRDAVAQAVAAELAQLHSVKPN